MTEGEKSRLITHATAIEMYKQMIADAKAALAGDSKHEERYRLDADLTRDINFNITTWVGLMVEEQAKLDAFKSPLTVKYSPGAVDDFIKTVVELFDNLKQYIPKVSEIVTVIIKLIKNLFN